jgi:separase
VLDKNIQDMPWESMTVLQDQPISRMPSLPFITVRAMQLQEQNTKKSFLVRDGVDASKTFYILNPSQDLKNTQEKFELQFSQYSN